MELIKNALIPLVVSISVLLLGVSTADAAIYLKADAPDGGDGTSWSTAFNKYNDAINCLRDNLQDGDPTIYIAKGIYTPTGASGTTTSCDITNEYFKILGGFRAAEDGDMVRDPEVYQTFLSGSSSSSTVSATWTRKWSEPGTFGYKTESAGKLLEKDENGNYRIRYPEFTGDYDFFSCGTAGGGRFLVCAKGSSGVIDGIRFVCCQRPSSNTSGTLALMSGAKDVVITNCVFAGNSTQGGVLNDSAGTASGFRTVVGCTFFGNRPSWGSGWAINSSGNTIVTNCLFAGNGRHQGDTNAGTMLSLGDKGSRVVDCVITHNAVEKGTLIAGNAVLERCRIVWNSGNYAADLVPGKLISLAKTKNNTSGELRGCLIASNRWEFSANPNSAYTLVGTGSTTYDNNPLVLDTVFCGNRLLAPVNTLTDGSTCALGIFGNSNTDKSLWANVVGCTFVSNEVSVADVPDGATVIRSRAVLSFGSSATSTQIGLANCTFFGPADGDADVVQYGAHAQPMNIVNCIFSDDDPNGLTNPFLTVTPPSTMNVIDCAIKNMTRQYEPMDLALISGTTYDPIPLAEAVTPSGGMALRPATKPPETRTSCDIAVNTATWPASYCIRTRETGAVWQSLAVKKAALSKDEKVETTDAFGVTRPFGGTTRGALQALTETAETGCTLTLRMDPPFAGTFSSPANQAVAAGAAIEPVTVSSDGEFSAWLKEDGSVYATGRTLTIGALDTDLLLTASFVARKVDVTFSLGEHATFDATGEHEYVTNVTAGAEFPEVPSFTVDDGWLFVKWPDLPTVTPDEDATYSAKVITKEKRTFFVAPVASGTGDGSSWENATDDFAAAYEDAGCYRGEVQMKGGVYRLKAMVPLKSNVAVIGGVDGAETVFTGDVNGDNVWKALGTTTVGPVWTDDVFNEPNQNGADRYWTAASVGKDDVWYGFYNAVGEVSTNAIFRHVTFTGFARSAVAAETGDVDGLVFESCRFLANGTDRNESYRTVELPIGANVSFDGCEFRGNYAVYSTKFTEHGHVNRFADCTFRDNSGCCLGFTFSCSTNVFDVTNCTFARNYSAGTTVLSISSTRHCPASRMTDCTIADNRQDGSLVGVYGNNQNGAGDYWPEPVLLVTRCSVTNNVRVAKSGGPLFLNSSDGRYYWSYYRDCYFGGNVCTNTGTSGSASLVYLASYNRPPFVGCTFERNEVVTLASGGYASIFHLAGNYSNQQLYGCVFAHNRLESATDGNAADLCNTGGDICYGFSVFSTIIDEEGDQTAFISTTTKTAGSFRNCVIRGYDESKSRPDVLPTFTDCVFGSAGVKAESEVGPNGMRALSLCGYSTNRWQGLPYWERNDGRGILYYYDGKRSRTKCFVCIGSGGESPDTEVAKFGVGLDEPPCPDAWGRARRRRLVANSAAALKKDIFVAPGPLNAPDLGLMLLVK